MQIWVDADACPRAIKEILFRAAERVRIPLTLVANKLLHTPRSPYLKAIRVPHGFDQADNRIVQLMQPGDLVVTADVPLAADVVNNGGHALDPRGKLFTEDNIQECLALRDLADRASQHWGRHRWAATAGQDRSASVREPTGSAAEPHTMIEFLQSNPIITLFIILGLGALLGRIHVLGVELGSVSGVLFVGLLLGHLGLTTPDVSVTTSGSPSSSSASATRPDRSSSPRSAWTALRYTLPGRAHRRYGHGSFRLAGHGAGLRRGHGCRTPGGWPDQHALPGGGTGCVCGTSEPNSAAAMENLMSAYAITYVFGLAGLVLFIALVPRILRIRVADEAQEYAADGDAGGGAFAYRMFGLPERPSGEGLSGGEPALRGEVSRLSSRTTPGRRISRGSNGEMRSSCPRMTSMSPELGDLALRRCTQGRTSRNCGKRSGRKFWTTRCWTAPSNPETSWLRRATRL